MCGRKSWTGVQEIKAGEEKRKRIGSKSYAVRRRVKNGFSWAELASWLDVSKQIHRQIMSIPRLYRVNPEITYCNVDVDVYASEALEPLTKALGKKISLHYVGREKNMHSAHFALSSFAKSQQPDLAIRSLAKLIEALPPQTASSLGSSEAQGIHCRASKWNRAALPRVRNLASSNTRGCCFRRVNHHNNLRD